MIKSSFYHMIEKTIGPVCKCGRILELGPGEVWPGLHLLQQQKSLEIIGLGYNSEERQKALAKAKVMGLSPYVRYEAGQLDSLALTDQSVDVVVSFGGLSQWEKPAKLFNEIVRVLKTGGIYFIGDVRQDTFWLTRFFAGQRSQELKTVYKSWKTGRTASDLREMLEDNKLFDGQVEVKGPDVWILKK